MTDEFVSRFGQLDLGPTHPNNPNDPALSLYDVSNLARRYDFDSDSDPGSAWAVDTRSGKRAFRIDVEGRSFLPDGRQIPTPRLVPRPAGVDAAAQLYGAPKSRAKGAAPSSVRPEAMRLAAALYPSKRGK